MVSTEFLVTIAALSAAMWLLMLWQLRSSARRGVTVLVGVSAFMLSLCSVADAVNRHYSYLPNVSDVVDAATGAAPPPLPKNLDELSPHAHSRLFTMGVSGGSGFEGSRAWVWLPPEYFAQPTRRFPVVYLLHGSPGMPKDWFHAGRAQAAGALLSERGMPAILVAPAMSKDWLDDPECVDGVHEKIESYFFHDVVPTVDATLRTIADRNARVLAGMSAGGFCALNLGLRHLTVVGSVVDLSGFTRPTHAGGMRALFGSARSPQVAENSPAVYASHLHAAPGTRVWLDSGLADREPRRDNAEIAPILRRDGVQVREVLRPGAHSYAVWRPALQQGLLWAISSAYRALT